MSKKDKKQHKAHEEGSTDHVVADASTSKMKSGKRKRDSELDASLDAHKENIVETGSKKRKKEVSTNVPENGIADSTYETVEPQPARKSKKHKKNKGSTLGVVDVEILQQAEINFHVKDYNVDRNDEEQVKKKKKHSEKTKTVSFKEPDEAAELSSKKKKHKKLKDEDLSGGTTKDESEETTKKKKHKKLKDTDLLLEEFTDKNDSEKSTKKRKHIEIEAQVAPKELEENENKQTTKKKKHKNKKAELVSPEKLNIANGDGSEQPMKKKKKHKEKTEEASPEELNKITSNENGQSSKKKKKRKDKEKKITAAPLKEGEDMNRNDRALQYLRLWKSSRSVWKFNKRMQVDLLHMMYNTTMMADEDFQIMLLYLDGLQGKGREKTMEDAKKILDNGEVEGNSGKEDRARQLYQMLA